MIENLGMSLVGGQIWVKRRNFLVILGKIAAAKKLELQTLYRER